MTFALLLLAAPSRGRAVAWRAQRQATIAGAGPGGPGRRPAMAGVHQRHRGRLRPPKPHCVRAGTMAAMGRLILGRASQFQDWLTSGRMYGQSMFTEAVLLGALRAVALTVQAAAVLVGAGAVWLAFRRPGLRDDMRLAVPLIEAPHVSNYDTVMLVVAVALLMCRPVADGFRLGDVIQLILAWGVEVLNAPKVISLGLLTTLVLTALLAAPFRCGEQGAAAE